MCSDFDVTLDRIDHLLQIYPYQPGYEHPAEKKLSGLLSYEDDDLLDAWRIHAEESKTFADQIHLLKQIEELGSLEWKEKFLKKCLESPKIEVRAAVVELASEWIDLGLVSLAEILMNHQEEVPFIQETIHQELEGHMKSCVDVVLGQIESLNKKLEVFSVYSQKAKTHIQERKKNDNRVRSGGSG